MRKPFKIIAVMAAVFLVLFVGLWLVLRGRTQRTASSINVSSNTWTVEELAVKLNETARRNHADFSVTSSGGDIIYNCQDDLKASAVANCRILHDLTQKNAEMWKVMEQFNVESVQFHCPGSETCAPSILIREKK